MGDALSLLLLAAAGAGFAWLALDSGVDIVRALRVGGRRVDSDAAALSHSRFASPVSIVVPLPADDDGTRTVEAALALEYADTEVIVVVDEMSDEKRAAVIGLWKLAPQELFYRRSLTTGAVAHIYSSRRDVRLLVVEKAAGSRADALNCGCNFARFQFVLCLQPGVTCDVDALQRLMAAVLRDRTRVVAVVSALEEAVVARPAEVFAWMASLRALMRVRTSPALSLASPGTLPRRRVIAWQREALIQAGGFSGAAADMDADLITRLTFDPGAGQSAATPRPSPVHVVQTSDVFGRLGPASADAQRAWRPAEMFRSRREVVTLVVACTAAIAALAGWLPWRSGLLVAAALSFGTAALTNAAVLVRLGLPSPPGPRESRRLIALGPFELLFRAAAPMLRQRSGE